MIRTIFIRSVMTMCMILLMTPCTNAESYEEEILKGTVFPLRHAISRGLEKNLDLKGVQLNIPMSRENAAVYDSAFDPLFTTSIGSLEQKDPTASPFSSEDFSLYRETRGGLGISKAFHFGLKSSLSFETNRSENNSSIDALRPQYRNYFILNITQPLLRDFGIKINTTNVRISTNQIRQASYDYIYHAQGLTEKIEISYYDLTQALRILQYRIKSRELARTLLSGNQKKFESGIVPITEVQEAETAVASREEQVISATQHVEIASNYLKDLLEIKDEDQLYKTPILAEPLTSIEHVFPNMDTALSLALEKRPDLKSQRMEILNRDIHIAYYKNQKLPRIDLEATLGLNGLSGKIRPVSFSGIPVTTSYEGDYADAFSNMARGEGYEWFVGVLFSYPLGNRSAKAQYQLSEQKKLQALYKLKRLERKAETEVKNAIIIINRSIERARVAEQFQNLAQTTLDQEMKRLQKGLSDTFRILNFQEKQIESCIRKVIALVDFNKGLATLYRAMGSNLERFDILLEINEKEINDVY